MNVEKKSIEWLAKTTQTAKINKRQKKKKDSYKIATLLN